MDGSLPCANRHTLCTHTHTHMRTLHVTVELESFVLWEVLSKVPLFSGEILRDCNSSPLQAQEQRTLSRVLSRSVFIYLIFFCIDVCTSSCFSQIRVSNRLKAKTLFSDFHSPSVVQIVSVHYILHACVYSWVHARVFQDNIHTHKGSFRCLLICKACAGCLDEMML